MDANAWVAVAGLGFVILTSLLGGAWYLGSGQSRIETKLDLALNNQALHETEDDRRFDEVKAEIKDLQREFRANGCHSCVNFSHKPGS